MTASLLALALAVRPQDADQVRFPLQVESSFERRWDAAAAANKHKDLLDLYGLAFETLSERVIQPDPAELRWVRLTVALAARLRRLPPAALEAHELVAQQAIDAVRDPEALDRVLERYAYTKAADHARAAGANRAADEGRGAEALRIWSADFERRPEAETAVKLAASLAARGERPALEALRQEVRNARLKGQVRMGGQVRELADLLGDLDKRPIPAAGSGEAPDIDLLLGRYDFGGQERAYAEELAACIPAAARVEDRDLVICTNGWRVVAIDPAKAHGGTLEDAVEWRYPREGAVRWGTRISTFPPPPPAAGVTVADGRAYVVMFPATKESNQRVGRKSDGSEGPSALRALDLATGRLLWDTETLETSLPNGDRTRVVDQADFGKRNFAFAGPPLARNGRLYALVMSSPVTERWVYAACFDGESGRILWTCPLVQAPPTRSSSQVPTLAEADGLLYVCTNLAVLAALDARSGSLEWAVKYREPIAPNLRLAASPPVVEGGLLYILPQDADELLAFDRWTGRPVALPRISPAPDWTAYRRLAGAHAGWLVLTGSEGAAMSCADGAWVRLAGVEGEAPGRPALAGGRLYVPTRSALLVFDAATWKLDRGLPWAEKAGNLLAAGDRLVFQSDVLLLFTGATSLQSRFAEKTAPAAPHGPACRQVGMIFEASGRPREAIAYYKLALQAWDKDPAWQESAEALRKKTDLLEERLEREGPPKQE